MDRTGKIVAFATDTVFGLGTPCDDSAGLDRLYHLKARPHHQPMQLLVANRLVAQDWVMLGEGDPLDAATRIYPLRPEVLLDTRLISNGGVAVRRPDHPALLAYLRSLGVPLAASSANKRGAPALNSADVVCATFPEARLVVGEACGNRPASMIWDMRVRPPLRLR